MKQKFAVVHRPDETSRQLKDELAGKLGNDERVEKLQKVTTKQELIDLFLN